MRITPRNSVLRSVGPILWLCFHKDRLGLCTSIAHRLLCVAGSLAIDTIDGLRQLHLKARGEVVVCGLGPDWVAGNLPH